MHCLSLLWFTKEEQAASLWCGCFCSSCIGIMNFHTSVPQTASLRVHGWVAPATSWTTFMKHYIPGVILSFKQQQAYMRVVWYREDAHRSRESFPWRCSKETCPTAAVRLWDMASDKWDFSNHLRAQVPLSFALALKYRSVLFPRVSAHLAAQRRESITNWKE